MVITLTGDNSFLIKQELSNITKDYDTLDIERIDCSQSSLDNVLAAIGSPGLFADKKLVIINDISLNKDLVEQIENVISQTDDSVELVIVEPKIDKRTSLFKILTTKTNLKNFAAPDTYKLASWIVEQTKQKGGKISNVSANYLVSKTGNNQELINNELNKLILYNEDITNDSVDLLTYNMTSSSIFTMLSAAFSGSRKQALNYYEEQINNGEDPYKIIGMMTWQLHLIALVISAKELSVSEIAKDAKLSPYSIENSRKLAASLDIKSVRQILKNLIEIDTKAKSTKIDLSEALRNFILKI